MADRDILILGLGGSGAAAANLALTQGARVTLVDAQETLLLQQRADHFICQGATVHLGFTEVSWAGTPDLAVISPGISPESSLGRLAQTLTCPVISELEFGFRSCTCPILAITGTNGKTTTTEMVVHILQGAGKRVVGAGNIGLPLSEAAAKSSDLDFIVAEVSSFQLEDCEDFAPFAAAFLNLTDDHLDRYKSLDAYLQTKLTLFKNMASADHIVMAHRLCQDQRVKASLPAGPPPVLFGGEEDKGNVNYRLAKSGEICYDSRDKVELLFRAGDLKLVGEHNLENACAALAICQLAGVSHETSVPLIKKFAPSAHRLELVAVHAGVTYINDSKATNPDALIQALKTCQAHQVRGNGKIVLIAGGLDKKMDFSGVIPYLQQLVKAVYLIGEARERLAALWQAAVPCRLLPSLAACVDAASDSAVSGDVVLLSPGCASQDMFSSYVERGNVFSQAIKRRLGE